jgi:predicted RNA methylase
MTSAADLAAGTGILSILDAEAGADRVYAFEKSDIVREWNKLVRAICQTSVIKIMNILAEDAPLTAKSADIIVSEWMGYFLLF